MFANNQEIDDMFGLLELNNKYKSKSLYEKRNTILNCEITRNIIRNLSLNNNCIDDANLEKNLSSSSLEKENEQQHDILSYMETTTLDVKSNSMHVNGNGFIDTENGDNHDNDQENNQEILGSNSSAKASFSFGFCKVCRDKATGIHYGIPSCEGCKGFFKRSLNKHEKYVCYFGNKCRITPKQRKRCKLCRWKSCLEAGMSFDSIRMGRIPKLEKQKVQNEQMNASLQQDELKVMFDLDDDDFLSPGEQSDGKKKPFSIERMCANDKENLINYLTIRNILSLSKKHDLIKKSNPSELVAQTHFSDIYLNTFNENILLILTMIRDKIYQLFLEFRRPYDAWHKRAMQIVNSQELRHQAPVGWDITPQQAWPLMLKLMGEHAKMFAHYCTQLPGFSRLNSIDLAYLVENNTFTAMVLRTARLFIEGQNYVMLAPDVQLSRDIMTKTLGAPLVEDIFIEHEEINQLELTDYELAAIMPLVITSVGTFNLIDPEPVLELNEYYKRVLLYEMSLNRRDEAYISRVNKILIKVTANEKVCRETNYIG